MTKIVRTKYNSSLVTIDDSEKLFHIDSKEIQNLIKEGNIIQDYPYTLAELKEKKIIKLREKIFQNLIENDSIFKALKLKIENCVSTKELEKLTDI